MFPEGNVPGYVCNPGSPRERDAASQGHTSGIPTRAILHSWKLAPAAHHVLLSILVMTSPHLTSGRQFWLITHMIQSWTTLMAFPIASRRSVSFPRGTRVTYVTRDVFKPLHEVPPALHILHVSLYLTHPLQVLQSPLMSWWVESGVRETYKMCRAGGSPGQVWEPLV